MWHAKDIWGTFKRHVKDSCEIYQTSELNWVDHWSQVWPCADFEDLRGLSKTWQSSLTKCRKRGSGIFYTMLYIKYNMFMNTLNAFIFQCYPICEGEVYALPSDTADGLPGTNGCPNC